MKRLLTDLGLSSARYHNASSYFSSCPMAMVPVTSGFDFRDNSAEIDKQLRLKYNR